MHDSPDHDVEFARPAKLAPASQSLRDECLAIRRSLNVNHVHYPESAKVGLSAELLIPDSPARRILSEGFHRIVVLDARQGLTTGGKFDLSTFLRYGSGQMAAAFDLPLDPEEFHPELISQILKDEPRSLFCFVNIEQMPYVVLQRLRGFTQESHQCLFCGRHDFETGLKAQPPPTEPDLVVPDVLADDSVSDLSLELDDSGILLLNEDAPDVLLDDDPGAAQDSGIYLLVESVKSSSGSEEPLESSTNDFELVLDDFDDGGDNEDSRIDHVLTVIDSEEGEEGSTADTVGAVQAPVPGAEFLESGLFTDRDRRLAAIAQQALLLVAREDFDGALDLLRALEQRATLAGMSSFAAISLGHQATVLRQRGDFAGAVDKLRQQEWLYVDLRNQCGVVESLGRQAELIAQQGDLEAAIQVLRQQEQACRQIGMWRELVESLSRQAVLLTRQENFSAALAARGDVEKIARLQGQHDLVVETLGHRGQLLVQLGSLPAALDEFREQERVAREADLHAGVAVALARQASVYEAQGSFPEALSNYQHGADLCRALGDGELLARNLGNQAFLVGRKMNRPKDGLRLANEAHALAVRHGLTQLATQIDRVRKSFAST